MYIDDGVVSEIKSKADLEELIRHYVTLKGRTQELTGDCPFCNGKKFSYSRKKKIYKCWHCDRGGADPIKFIMEKENVEYQPALLWLAGFYNIYIPDSTVLKSTSKKDGKKKISVPPLSNKDQGDFFKKTLYQVGLTQSKNKVYLQSNGKPFPERYPLIDEDQDGNLEFILYDVAGNIITYAKNGSIEEPYKVIRLQIPALDSKGNIMKYRIPRGCGTRPYFPPDLIRKYKENIPIETLFITEGYKKAIAGSLNGLDIVGLSSISTYRDKDTLQLHKDVIDLILICKVQNVCLLYDGDCRNISLKALEENKDISVRPNNFFASAKGIKELLKDYLKSHEIALYFCHVNSDAVEGSPKGLDDLYEAFAAVEFRAVGGEAKSSFTTGRRLINARRSAASVLNQDLYSFSRPGTYFTKINITFGLQKLLGHLSIDNANNFYHFHAEVIKDRAFIYSGTQYRYNIEKNECEIIIPAAARLYLRVGDDYFEKVPVPNKYQELEEQLHRRSKITISDDHGKNFLSHIRKYKAFCNVPCHDNYQEVISGCYNMYSRFTWEPEPGPCDVTLSFIRHIFEEHYELGLDYLQLLYQRPTQILPILCLVSKENSTGKSTFAKWLKAIYKSNMAIIGNAELTSDFNGAFATRLITVCDETYIDKRAGIEKIKSLSTADRVVLNQKGRDHIEIEFFGKFILLTNNESNFIFASEEDIRYWVRKVKPPAVERVNVLSDMIAEIPAFLFFLSKRVMFSQQESRMWFHPKLITTDALKRVVAQSKPGIVKELRTKLETMFKDFEEDIIYMSITDIKRELLSNRFEESYIATILRETLNVEQYWEPDPDNPAIKKYKLRRYSFPKWERTFSKIDGSPEVVRLDIKSNGRPFVFLRPDFVSPEVEETIIHDPEMAALALPVPPHYLRAGMLRVNNPLNLPF